MSTKAMIFAAGRGSRLLSLTDTTPKCMIEIGGKPMLEHVVDRLKDVGVRSIAINTSYLAEQVTDFISAQQNFGIEIYISHEPVLLETGGGLKKAAQYFDDVPYFYVHNADIYSTISLTELKQSHEQSGAEATLATLDIGKEPRCLLFSEEGQLCGWRNKSTDKEWQVVESDVIVERAFTGIQIVAKGMLERIRNKSEEQFSTVTSYLEGSRDGAKVLSYEASEDALWHDIGTPEQLEQVRHELAAISLPKE